MRGLREEVGGVAPCVDILAYCVEILAYFLLGFIVRLLGFIDRLRQQVLELLLRHVVNRAAKGKRVNKIPINKVGAHPVIERVNTAHVIGVTPHTTIFG